MKLSIFTDNWKGTSAYNFVLYLDSFRKKISKILQGIPFWRAPYIYQFLFPCVRGVYTTYCTIVRNRNYIQPETKVRKQALYRQVSTSERTVLVVDIVTFEQAEARNISTRFSDTQAHPGPSLTTANHTHTLSRRTLRRKTLRKSTNKYCVKDCIYQIFVQETQLSLTNRATHCAINMHACGLCPKTLTSLYVLRRRNWSLCIKPRISR